MTKMNSQVIQVIIDRNDNHTIAKITLVLNSGKMVEIIGHKAETSVSYLYIDGNYPSMLGKEYLFIKPLIDNNPFFKHFEIQFFDCVFPFTLLNDTSQCFIQIKE